MIILKYIKIEIALKTIEKEKNTNLFIPFIPNYVNKNIFFCILYPQRNIIEQKKGELDGEMKGKEDTISTNFLSLCMIALITLLGV